MQSDSNPSNDELPQDFTSRIINIIQNKQHERQEINLNSETEDEHSAPPSKNNKQSCKKSGKRDELNINQNTQAKPQKKFRNNQYQGSNREAVINKAYDAISEEESSNLKKEARGNKVTESKNQQILQGHQILKEYFQQFLTKVLKKMQDDTNKILNQMLKKTDYLQQRLQSLSLAQQSKGKEPQTDQEYNINDQKQKKHPYIKNWMKLNYVQKIERKEMTVREVAKELKVKQSVVQEWLTNKKKNKLKASNKKQYKVGNGNQTKKKTTSEYRSDNHGDIEYDFLDDIE